jgi:hypothetical protein
MFRQFFQVCRCDYAVRHEPRSSVLQLNMTRSLPQEIVTGEQTSKLGNPRDSGIQLDCVRGHRPEPAAPTMCGRFAANEGLSFVKCFVVRRSDHLSNSIAQAEHVALQLWPGSTVLLLSEDSA